MSEDDKTKGRALLADGRCEAAASFFRSALKANPRDPEALNLLGQALDGIGFRPEGLAAIRKAVRLAPKYATGWYDLGVLLAKKPDGGPEAMRCFLRALKCDPPPETRLWAYYASACLFAVQGNKEAALEGLELAMAAGFDDLDYLERDRDLDCLRDEPAFRELVARCAREMSYEGLLAADDAWWAKAPRA